MRFADYGKRVVFAAFDGGEITSDAGVLLLREQARRIHLFERMAGCFTDHRDRERLTHTLPALLAQRVCGMALGYEDIIDHDTLRFDPALKLLASPRTGDPGTPAPLAGKSTLNRLEPRQALPGQPDAGRSVQDDEPGRGLGPAAGPLESLLSHPQVQGAQARAVPDGGRAGAPGRSLGRGGVLRPFSGDGVPAPALYGRASDGDPDPEVGAYPGQPDPLARFQDRRQDDPPQPARARGAGCCQADRG